MQLYHEWEKNPTLAAYEPPSSLLLLSPSPLPPSPRSLLLSSYAPPVFLPPHQPKPRLSSEHSADATSSLSSSKGSEEWDEWRKRASDWQFYDQVCTTPRNQIQKNAFLVQIVLKWRFLGFDFGLYPTYLLSIRRCCSLFSPSYLLSTRQHYPHADIVALYHPTYLLCISRYPGVVAVYSLLYPLCIRRYE
eukprot:2850136-Rhodomonas_salina.2